jgi:hypothetical protein
MTTQFSTAMAGEAIQWYLRPHACGTTPLMCVPAFSTFNFTLFEMVDAVMGHAVTPEVKYPISLYPHSAHPHCSPSHELTRFTAHFKRRLAGDLIGAVITFRSSTNFVSSRVSPGVLLVSHSAARLPSTDNMRPRNSSPQPPFSFTSLPVIVTYLSSRLSLL